MRSSTASVRSTGLCLMTVSAAWCVRMTAIASSVSLNVKCVLPMCDNYHYAASIVAHSLKDLRYCCFTRHFQCITYYICHIGNVIQGLVSCITLHRQVQSYARIEKETRISEKNVLRFLAKSSSLVLA